MEAWEKAWLNGGILPPHEFPNGLLLLALDIADQWIGDPQYRCTLEEWVPRKQARTELLYLFYNGFRLRGQAVKREQPIPVLTRLVYTQPYPADYEELRERMRVLYAGAVKQWCNARAQYGDELEGAP